MPIPTPSDGESHDDFIDRCMGSDTMNTEYPDEAQRYAVCQSQWEKDQDDEKSDKPEIERRVLFHAGLELEKRADGAGKLPNLRGYAAMFNSPTELWPGMVEKIAPGAFTRTLAEGADVRALFNHDPNLLLGRTKSGTLSLEENKKGLKVLIQPPDTSVGRDVVASIERGDLDQMSFAFRVKEDDYTYSDDGTTERTIKDVDLYDVSPVTFPAYPTTSVEVVKRFFEARAKSQKAPDKPGPMPVVLAEAKPKVRAAKYDEQNVILQRLHEQKIYETKHGSPYVARKS